MPETDVSRLITVEQALAILDAAPVVPRIVRVKLSEAQGLHLAQDIATDRDYPPFDKSQMDGFALRAADASGATVRLKLVGEIAAGSDAGAVLGEGEAVKIMTGAPLPSGADAVIPVEMLQRSDGDLIELRGPAAEGKFMSPRGSDCARGQTVLRRGQKLEAAQLAVAATVGALELDVFARPRVGVLATGDEIIPFDQAPTGSQIRNCNSILLTSLLRRLGCQVNDLGMVRDDPMLIRQAISRGVEEHEVLLVTGGMSMGDYDYVPRVLRELGAELKITKLRIKPGKPFVFALLPLAASRMQDHRLATPQAAAPARLVFGLPGNPVSGFACTLRLCARLLARLSGAAPMEKWTRAILLNDLPANGPREFYQPAQLLEDATVRPLQWKSSGDVFTLAQANCLLVRAENESALSAGSAVRVLEVPT